VHGHDGARPRGDRGGHGCRIEQERVRVDVDEHRPRATQLDGIRSRGEGVGGHDDLVPGPDLECEQRQVERGGAGRDHCRVPGSHGDGDRCLELDDLRTHRELAAAENLLHCCEFRVADVRPRQPDRISHFPPQIRNLRVQIPDRENP
jgi:hypothetical protein